MGKTRLSSAARDTAWRLAFAGIGALAALRLSGDSTPWMVAGTLLGFQLGRWLGPLTDRALSQLDPRPPKPTDPPPGDRATNP
jgi:hypothetical protein